MFDWNGDDNVSNNNIVLTQNGFINKNELHYPFEERGLQFGDGVYEVIRIYQGTTYLLDEHLARLFRSAQAIKLQLPFDHHDLKLRLLELIEVNEMQEDGKIYLQITRGSAKRDHLFPNISINFHAYIEQLPRPLAALANGVKTITLPDQRWQNCYIKSLNLLPNVLAKQEAANHGAFEAILHRDQLVTECSSSNIYIVKQKEIYTHPPTNQILHGCVRERLKVLATKLSISFHEQAFSLKELKQADEVFLTSSTTEVMPVVQVDHTTINNGFPGAVTQLLQKAYIEDIVN